MSFFNELRSSNRQILLKTLYTRQKPEIEKCSNVADGVETINEWIVHKSVRMYKEIHLKQSLKALIIHLDLMKILFLFFNLSQWNARIFVVKFPLIIVIN